MDGLVMTIDRSKFSGKLEEKQGHSDNIRMPLWYTGEDVPISWDKNTLAVEHFRSMKVNFFRGNITKEQYLAYKEKYNGTVS